MSNPLAEVFGFPIQNQTDRARQYRQHRLCPFNNGTANCTKNSIDDPLGVCSIYHRNEPVITCPVRFREDWQLVRDASAFFFPPGMAWTSLGEVKLKDRHGAAVGKIDYVLVAYDDRGRVLDFASLEVQAVYESERQINEIISTNHLVKRYEQNGRVMASLGKKRAIAVPSILANSLPEKQEVTPESADTVWLIYDLIPDAGLLKLRLRQRRYTSFRKEEMNNQLTQSHSFLAEWGDNEQIELVRSAI